MYDSTRMLMPDFSRSVCFAVQLPGISGTEATERIREHARSLNLNDSLLIFGLTGNVDGESMKLYEAAGMNGCILKGKVLGEALRQAIEQVHTGTKFAVVV